MDEAVSKMDSSAGMLSADARFLSNSPVVHRFLDTRGEPGHSGWRALAGEEFRALLAGKPSYFQVRLIDLGDSGRELLRLGRDSSGVTITAEADLQEKGGRDYVREAAALLAGNLSDVYLSEINLNQEFGRVSEPHTPTLRAVSAVSGSPDILAVINADVSSILREMVEGIAPGAELRIAGERGDYLAHPDPDKIFGVDLSMERSSLLRDDFPETTFALPADGLLLSRPGETAALVFARQTQIGSTPPREFTLVGSLPGAAWLPELEALRLRAVFVALAAAAAGAAAVFLISRPMVRRLQQLATAIENYDTAAPPTELTAALPGGRVEHQDEVGVVAQRFRELDGKLRAQVASLEAATAAREEFLAVMSHEIRTPMNAVIGMVRALETNRPAEHQEPLIRTLRASASNLLALVNTALDYTKLRAGDLTFAAEDFDPSALVLEIAAANTPSALEKNIALETAVSPALPGAISGDPVRLRQILTNLVANAVRFTTSGTITLACEIPDGIGNRLRATVTDTGRGIDPADRERIFAPFEQAGPRLTDEPGTGLGLTITRALVERQGGSLTVKSSPGEGSTFVVELPFSAAAAADLTPAAPDRGHDFTSARILYAEDVASNCAVLTASLEGTGAETDFVSIGAAAIAALESRRYDIALLDLKLPDIEGDVLARKLQSLDPALPLVAVTAQAGDAVHARCLAVGMHGFLLKPYEPVDLRAQIYQHLTIPPAEPGDDSSLRDLFSDPERQRSHRSLIARELRAAADEVATCDPAPLRHRLATVLSQLGLDALSDDLLRLSSQDVSWLRLRCQTRLTQAIAIAEDRS